MKDRISALWVFVASVMWAGDAPFRKPLLTGGLSAPFVAFLEHAINAVCGLPAIFKRRSLLKNLSLKHWLGFFYIGAGASALAAILFVQGAVYMNYNFTVAALLQKFQPFFATVFAAMFLKEKLSFRFWLLALPVFIGAYLVSFGLVSPLEILSAVKGGSLWGPVLAVFAAVLWAGGTVVGKAVLNNIDFGFVTGMRFVFGFLFLFFYLLFFGSFQFSLMSGFFWQNTAIIALLTGFFALSLYYYGLKNTKASFATFMELGYPLALTAVNWIFLDIKLSSVQIFGALLLLIFVTFMIRESSRSEVSV